MDKKPVQRKGELNIEELLFWVGALLLLILALYFVYSEGSSFFNWAKTLFTLMRALISCFSLITGSGSVSQCVSDGVRAIMDHIGGALS